MRSPSEERAEADIASLEAQLKERKAAKKFGECAALKERINQMKKALTDISRLKVQLEEAEADDEYTACADIQKQIDELKVPIPHASLPLHIPSFLHPILCRCRWPLVTSLMARPRLGQKRGLLRSYS